MNDTETGLWENTIPKVAFVTESSRSPRRRELVEPGPMRRDREAPASMRRDMEPPASRCWWMAMASAWRCRSSSSAGVSLGPRAPTACFPSACCATPRPRPLFLAWHARERVAHWEKKPRELVEWKKERWGGDSYRLALGSKQIGEGEQQLT
ncbi:hypothetical protein SEVIR_6G086450v4 [Setaria viridis]